MALWVAPRALSPGSDVLFGEGAGDTMVSGEDEDDDVLSGGASDEFFFVRGGSDIVTDLT